MISSQMLCDQSISHRFRRWQKDGIFQPYRQQVLHQSPQGIEARVSVEHIHGRQTERIVSGVCEEFLQYGHRKSAGDGEAF